MFTWKSTKPTGLVFLERGETMCSGPFTFSKGRRYLSFTLTKCLYVSGGHAAFCFILESWFKADMLDFGFVCQPYQ